MGKAFTFTLFVVSAALAIVYGDNFTSITRGDLLLAVSDFELPWAQAVNACLAVNKTLLKVENEEKDKILVDLFVNGGSNVSLPGSNSWISVAESKEGVWTNGNEQPLFYTRWFIGQPDDTENLNCAYQAVSNLLYWRDANCSAPMYFVCESKL